MSDESNNPFEQASAFQKIWTDSMAKMAQASFTFSPETAPPELLREIRSGIFKALTHSWEQFLRSPEFLDSMRKMMKNAANFKQMNSELLNRAQHEMQGTNRNDVDAIMLNIRHLESRVLDHLESISDRLTSLESKGNGTPTRATPKKKKAPVRKTTAKAQSRAQTKKTPVQRKKRS